MRSIKKYLLALGLATSLTACAVPADNYYANESYGVAPRYTGASYAVVENSGNVELRDYQPMLVAEITEVGDRETAVRNGFLALKDYFDGNNGTGEIIAMTKPVVQFPVYNHMHGYRNTVDSMKWVIRFYLPGEYGSIASVPIPGNAAIRITRTRPMSVAVLSYSGPWTNDNLQSNENALRDYIHDNGLHGIDVPAYAYYDAPSVSPWNRHNEILIKLAD